MRSFILLISFSLSVSLCISQNTKSEMALYNIGLGSLVSGFGAVINKKPDEKFGKVFFRGLYQGALGGYLVYESKNLVGRIAAKKRLEYSWPAKLLNSAGISIIESAALNNSFGSRWHINFGFNRIELDFREKLKLQYRVMPISFALTAYVTFGNKFELEKTLRTGEFIFSNNNLQLGSLDANGFNYGNVMVISNTSEDMYSTISHELIHTYQYYDFNFVNTYFHKTLSNLETKSFIFKRVEAIFYLDLQGPFLRGLYLLEKSNSDYYANFFENEAGFWSNTIK